MSVYDLSCLSGAYKMVQISSNIKSAEYFIGYCEETREYLLLDKAGVMSPRPVNTTGNGYSGNIGPPMSFTGSESSNCMENTLVYSSKKQQTPITSQDLKGSVRRKKPKYKKLSFHTAICLYLSIYPLIHISISIWTCYLEGYPVASVIKQGSRRSPQKALPSQDPLYCKQTCFHWTVSDASWDN